MERHCQIPILTSRLMEASGTLVMPRLPTARGKWEAVGWHRPIARRRWRSSAELTLILAEVRFGCGEAGKRHRGIGTSRWEDLRREGSHLDKQARKVQQGQPLAVGRGKTFRLAGHSGPQWATKAGGEVWRPLGLRDDTEL